MNKLRIKNGELLQRRNPQLLCLLLLVFLLAACGGGTPAAPTAIPASVAQPQQPKPELVKGKPVFESTNDATPVIIVPATETDIDPSLLLADEGTPTPLSLSFHIPPTALGIATGGASIVDAPNGRVVATVPAGSTLTVTGRSSDGKFLAVYEDDGTAGWVTVGSLQLYGADDLTVVEQPIFPAPIITLLAEQMIPLETSALDAAMTAEAKSTSTFTLTVASTPVP
ncbi:MAG: SH3 domain-containing protein [Caldilineaceae bacterium]